MLNTESGIVELIIEEELASILKIIDMDIEIYTLDYGTSDHNPVILRIEGSQEQNYHFTQNWNTFQTLAQERIKVPTINNVVELEQRVKSTRKSITAKYY